MRTLPKRWDLVIKASMITLLVFLSYLPAFHAGFVFDDHYLIRNNELLRGPFWKIWLNTTASDYWPLTWTAFWLQWHIWAESAAGYHVISIILHIIVSLLLWRVLKTLQIPGAWLAGLLFGVHPVTVESVAWISELKNTLSGALYLGAILAWLRFDGQRSLRQIGITLFLFVFALLGKASVVMLPVVLLFISVYRHGKLHRQDWIRTLPFFVFALIAGVVNLWFQWQNAMAGGGAPARGIGERIGATGWALLSYMEKAFFPVRLAFVYPEWPTTPSSFFYYLPLIILVSAILVLWFFGRREGWSRAVLYALAYHALLLLPVLGLVDIAYFIIGPVSNHLQYLALMGPVTLIAAGIVSLPKRIPAIGIIVAVALVGAFATSTFFRSATFKDDLTLWTAAVHDSPHSVFARNQLTALLLDRGRRLEALDHLDAAARFARDPAEQHRFRSQWFLYSGQKHEAIAEAREALRVGRSPEVRDEAAFVLGAAGETSEAIEVYRALQREFPRASGYAYTLAAALARTGHISEAADVLRTYCTKYPGNPLMEEAFALTLIRLGLLAEARERAAVLLGVDPADPRVLDRVDGWRRTLTTESHFPDRQNRNRDQR